VVINKLKAEIEEIKSNKVFENAFEWRFEFPEVLNDNGDFVGFDVVIGNPPYIRQEEITWMKQYLELNYSTFTGTADLYVYFVELGLNLLKSSGAFIYILPNKWMRAGYGSALRSKLKDVALHQIIDFGDLPVFEEATTYPCILHFSASNPQTVFEAVQVDTLDYPNGMNGYIDSEKYEVIQSSLGKSGWTLIDNQSQKLMEKIRSAGVPLSEYVEGKIYRGVLTGLNEAFVINENTKQQLIREDPLSAEIIKPFLAGRDIKRYQQPNSNKYLIFTRRGIEIEKYPAILNHLEKFKDRLVPKHKDWKGKNWSGRKPGSYKWYEIQDAVDYYEQFKQVKILWPGITDNITSFAFDEQQFFGNDNNQLIISPSKYLLAILNSSVSNFLLRNICDFVRGGFVRLKIAYVSQIPIPSATDEQYTSISNIVAQILKTRKANQKANTTSLEKEIDQLVYGLYGLSEEEIGIIENAKNIY
jgi:hypothetical protein